jgi:hypothetical protein
MTETPGQPAARGQWATINCLTVTCARCGASPEYEGCTLHFSSPEDAREQLAHDYGWRITQPVDGSGEMLCDGCAVKDDCTRLGHQPELVGPLLRDDGWVLGSRTWCSRCEELLASEPDTPAPGGYLAPEPAFWTVHWDAAALPAGGEIADASERLLARLSDDANAARWDAWDGDKKWRPGRLVGPDPEADKDAALILIKAAHQLLCAAVAASTAPSTVTSQGTGQ